MVENLLSNKIILKVSSDASMINYILTNDVAVTVIKQPKEIDHRGHNIFIAIDKVKGE